MKSVAIKIAVTSFLVACLSGCLGGGGDSGNNSSPPIVATLEFDVRSAYITLVAYGSAGNFTISGSCNGTGSKSDAPAATATIFEGVAGLSAVGILSLSYSNCTPSLTARTYTNYYDSNYTPLGYSSEGAGYGVFLTPPSMPSKAMVGDTGMVGTITMYADSSKTVGSGRQDISYVVEADTAVSAIVNLITKIHDIGGVLISTVQDKYRITATGPMVPVSSDIQTPNASASHLIWTYN